MTNVSEARILIIDDEAAVCDVMAMILEDAGYVVEKATGGLEALARIKKKLPALVVLDLMMPNVSGWDVYQTLRAAKRTRKVPVVVVSADRDVLARARTLGANALISKPFQLEELLSIVHDNLPEITSARSQHSRCSQGAA
jgi:CheY-like chemotaxis protein